MPGIVRPSPYICTRCLRARSKKSSLPRGPGRRRYANGPPSQQSADNVAERKKEEGAMSRRLSELSEESLETGGRGARKAVEEAGFSEDLKRQLEERIASASFRSDNASAFAQAEAPSYVGRGSRDVAAASAWTGTESVEDASLRMLTDAHKPMRGPAKIPGIRGPPTKVDTGRSRSKPSAGAKLANARDKTSMYAFLKDASVSDKEREKFRAELKERFQPGARAVPATIQGLASLANERIEDAYARGQFKNLPGRGKQIERDYNASSPFLDTTEYFMNKIIQKQDIVPPWIEKQQELVSTANKFRGRLRADWRRHVARTISSRGGSLQGQMRLAEEYALAEAVENPPKRKEEKLNAVDGGGHVSQITLAGELKAVEVKSGSGAKTEAEITVTEQAADDDGKLRAPEEQITVTAEIPTPSPASSAASPDIPQATENTDQKSPTAPASATSETTEAPDQPTPTVEASPPTSRRPTVAPFRDPTWAQTERSYHALAVENLNNLTRSYNLMAPNLAKKPYFSLERELKACYADVAPSVADAIRQRALAPKIKGVEVIGHTPGGVLEKFAMDKAKVYDERRPQYGFKQFWRDLFAKQ